MDVVSDIERQLGRLRASEAADGMPELRTSTMTHIVWCPPEWRAKARATLAGLLERHPARTIFLIPEPGGSAGIEAKAELKDFHVHGLSREILSEVIEIRLRGTAARHPGSIVLPLLVSDLPVFCRWRGEPAWGSHELEEIVSVTDRFVVDSAEWRRTPGGIPDARGDVRADGGLGHRVLADAAVAPSARGALARDPARRGESGSRGRAPTPPCWRDGSAHASSVRSRSPAGRLQWSRRSGLDGEPVESPGDLPNPSELLSAELDQFGRDRIYEAAVRAV